MVESYFVAVIVIRVKVVAGVVVSSSLGLRWVRVTVVVVVTLSLGLELGLR